MIKNIIFCIYIYIFYLFNIYINLIKYNVFLTSLKFKFKFNSHKYKTIKHQIYIVGDVSPRVSSVAQKPCLAVGRS